MSLTGSNPSGNTAPTADRRTHTAENIIICIDTSNEMNKPLFRAKNGDLHTPIDLIKKALCMFVSTKLALHPNHSFWLLTLDEAALFATRSTTRSWQSLSRSIQGLRAKYVGEECDLSSLFEHAATVSGVIGPASGTDDAVTRVIMLYGRSATVPSLRCSAEVRAFLQSPRTFIDCLYIHEEASEHNQVEKTFRFFCELDAGSATAGYIKDVTSSPTCFYNEMAQLISHPLQRPRQIHSDMYRLPPKSG